MKKIVSGFLASLILLGSAAALPEENRPFDSVITANASSTNDGKITDKTFLKDIAWFGESPAKIDGVKGYRSMVFKNGFNNNEKPVSNVLSVKNDYEYCYDDIWYSNTYRYAGVMSSLNEMYVMEAMPKKKSDNTYANTKLKGTVKIKSKVNGIPVKQIQAMAFNGQKKITKFVIPEGIETVGVDSLNCMDGLKKLYLPKSLKIEKNSNSIGYIDNGKSFTINKNLVIYCWYGSDAHKYAKENGFKYILRDKNKSKAKYLYKAKVTLSSKSYVYNGKERKPSVTVKYGKTTLKKGKDYTVSYKKNKKPGIATVVIKGKGKYDGIIKKTFKIKPKATTVKSVTSPDEATIKVTLNKVDTISKNKDTEQNGYIIVCATDKDFKKNVRTIETNKTTEIIEGMRSGVKYFVKARAYVGSDSERVYGKYSKTVSIKVK